VSAPGLRLIFSWRVVGGALVDVSGNGLDPDTITGVTYSTDVDLGDVAVFNSTDRVLAPELPATNGNYEIRVRFKPTAINSSSGGANFLFGLHDPAETGADRNAAAVVYRYESATTGRLEIFHKGSGLVEADGTARPVITRDAAHSLRVRVVDEFIWVWLNGAVVVSGEAIQRIDKELSDLVGYVGADWDAASTWNEYFTGYISELDYFEVTSGAVYDGTVETFAALASSDAGEWVAWVTIEGVGDAAGLTRWAYRVPAFAQGDSAWEPLLQRLDPPIPPTADQRGGVSMSGSVSFSLLDRGEAVTSALRLDARPRTALAAACAFAASTCEITSAAGISEGDVLFLGREAVVVMAISGTTLVIERGVLDTEREPHASGELVYLGLPAIEGRKVRLHYAAANGRTGVPFPASGAIETHDDGRWDVLSLRCQDASGDPVDSSRGGNDCTASAGLLYGVDGPMGPLWTSLGFDGETSRTTTPTFGPTGGDLVLVLGLVHGGAGTPVKFSRNAAISGGTNSLLAITVEFDDSLTIEFMGATRAIATQVTHEKHLIEVVVRDRGAGNGSTLWFYLDGVEVDEWSPSARVADASWTGAGAQAPSIGSGLNSSGTAEDYYTGRIFAVRVIDAWASGPYRAAERWRHTNAMTPASIEWGMYRAEPPGLSEDMNSWELRAISDAMGVRDLVCRSRADRWDVFQVDEPSRTLFGALTGDRADLWVAGRHHLRLGDELLAIDEIFSGFFRVAERGLLGTPTDRPLAPGPARFVYLADSLRSDAAFRYSPGAALGGGTPSTSRSSGTWTVTSHWVPLILSILTSSADEDDGLELANYDPDVGNFAALPPGVGIGFPWHRVDWTSWLAVWQRTPDWVFDGFVLGDQESFGELIEREFLRPIGAWLDEHRGKASIVLPRLPASGDTLLELGPSSVLTRSVGRGRAVPEISFAKTAGLSRSSVTFRVRSRSGAEVPISITDPAVLRLYGGRRQGLPFGAEEVSIPSVLVRDGDSVPWLERLATRYLYYTRRSAWEIKASATWDLEGARRGEFVGVTNAEFPDLESGTRGITARPARVEERTPVVAPGEPVRLDLRVLMLGAGTRVGRIAPSAVVVSSTGAGPYVVTVDANRYTDTDAGDGLPTADASGFSAGDVVRLANRDGSSASGGTETISAVSGNTITIGGNFSGALAAGLVLEYADRASMVAAQYNSTVIAADQATRTVGASTDDVWLWGQA